MGILGAVWPDLSTTAFAEFPLLDGTLGMILVGLILGGVFGAIFYSLIELGRDQ